MALPHIGAAIPLLREFTGAAAVLAAGAGATAWGALVPRAQLFGRTIRHTGPPEAGLTDKPDTLALTFDDGPNPALTPRLLRLLEEHRVRATFFLIGRFVRECPSLVAEIAAQGHTIGNHTYTHPRLFWMTPAQIADELARCQDAIHQACGQRPVWMRPPFGIRGPHLSHVVRRAGFRGVVMWSRWARDWKPKHITTMVDRLRRVRGGDILLLHDGDHRHLRSDRHLTLAALDYWLPMWKNAGLGFVTLDDIVGRRAPVSAPSPQKDFAPAPLRPEEAGTFRKSSARGE